MSVTFHVVGVAADLFNISNDNCRALFRLIDYDSRYLVGQVPYQELPIFRHKVTFVLESLYAMPDLDAGQPPTVLASAPGATLIECGHEPGYFRDRLTRLLYLIDLAIVHHTSLAFA